jgi:hypothetical protein
MLGLGFISRPTLQMLFLQNIQIRTLAPPLLRSRTEAKFMKSVAKDPTESALRCYEQVMKVNPFCSRHPAFVHLGRRRLCDDRTPRRLARWLKGVSREDLTDGAQGAPKP